VIRRTAGGALLAAGVAAVAVIPAASGSSAGVRAAAKKPVKRSVKVRDYYFAPEKLSVPRRSTITWKWPSEDQSGELHNVKLVKGPKGVKHFKSQYASSDYSYKRKLRKRGKYTVICQLHPYDMRMTIRVK
jgi:plastocyanin